MYKNTAMKNSFSVLQALTEQPGELVRHLAADEHCDLARLRETLNRLLEVNDPPGESSNRRRVVPLRRCG